MKSFVHEQNSYGPWNFSFNKHKLLPPHSMAVEALRSADILVTHFHLDKNGEAATQGMGKCMVGEYDLSKG